MAVAHKGLISMGLVLIPIGLYKTTTDTDIHFNQLEKETKQRIQYKKYCNHCKEEITTDDIIKGYEYEKGKYVVMTDEDFEKIKTKKDKTIHIIQFADMSEIDTIYYEKDYYVVPDPGAEKAYELLRQSMLQQNKVAIAKTVMGSNQKLLALYPTDNAIIAKVLFYAAEVVANPKPIPKMTLDENELNMAKMLIENMTRAFDASQYKDDYQERLRAAIMQKIQGKEIVSVAEGAPDNVIDLMDALKKSLELTSETSKPKNNKPKKPKKGTA